MGGGLKHVYKAQFMILYDLFIEQHVSLVSVSGYSSAQLCLGEGRRQELRPGPPHPIPG